MVREALKRSPEQAEQLTPLRLDNAHLELSFRPPNRFGRDDARTAVPLNGFPSSHPYRSVSNRGARASIMRSRPTSPSPKPTISRMTSSPIRLPSTPASAPSTPASAQAGTAPGGGGAGNRQR